MDAAHFHLAINHFPVVGLCLAAAILVLTQVVGSDEQRRVALWFTLVVGLLAAPAYFSGERAEESVEHLEGFSESLIEEHEETAELALILALATAALAGLALELGRRQHRAHGLAAKAATLLALAGSGAMAWTANSGGHIRHPELRGEAQFAPAEVQLDSEERDEEDDYDNE